LFYQLTGINLSQIGGVGAATTLTVFSEIGWDMSKFPTLATIIYCMATKGEEYQYIDPEKHAQKIRQKKLNTAKKLIQRNEFSLEGVTDCRIVENDNSSIHQLDNSFLPKNPHHNHGSDQ